MIQGRRTPLDFFFFLRPVLLPPVWTIALLGTVSTDSSLRMDGTHWAAFFFHLTALFGGVYTLNQICDIESDRINRKLYFLPERIISVRAAWIFTVALDVVALGLSLAFGWTHFTLTATIIVLGVAYSVGTSPWKNSPWLGLISNAVGHGLAVYLFGRIAFGLPLVEGWARGAAYSLAVAAVFLATTIPDVEGDRMTGKRTPAVAWGQKNIAMLAMVVVLGAIGLAAWQGDRYLALSATVSWPFFLLAIFRPWTASTAAKAAVGALSIAAVVAYPMYLVVLVIGFVVTRLFFRWRFGISYPSLS